MDSNGTASTRESYDSFCSAAHQQHLRFLWEVFLQSIRDGKPVILVPLQLKLDVGAPALQLMADRFRYVQDRLCDDTRLIKCRDMIMDEVTIVYSPISQAYMIGQTSSLVLQSASPHTLMYIASYPPSDSQTQVATSHVNNATFTGVDRGAFTTANAFATGYPPAANAVRCTQPHANLNHHSATQQVEERGQPSSTTWEGHNGVINHEAANDHELNTEEPEETFETTEQEHVQPRNIMNNKQSLLVQAQAAQVLQGGIAYYAGQRSQGAQNVVEDMHDGVAGNVAEDFTEHEYIMTGTAAGPVGYFAGMDFPIPP
jgi:hypothetical protein